MPTIARNERLDAQLKELPDSPGVYLFHDRDGVVLYVGKAKSLRKRVQSYFRREAYATLKTAELVDRIEEIEFVAAGSEHEALLLEQNLIKRHRPPFNIRLRDDKSYPYIAVTTSDEYPRVMFTRERHRRGVLYFGPYSSAKKVRETLDVLNRVFPYRPCEGPQPGRRSGVPCLDHHIGRCAAPCVGLISKEDYAAVIDSVVEFLSGRVRPLERRLEQQMKDAAARHEFEEAARYRNRLTAVRHLSAAPGGRPRRLADRRRAGGRRLRHRRQRAAVPAARRPPRRPPQLLPRQRRRRARVRGAVGIRARVLRRPGGDPAVGDRAHGVRGRRPAGHVPVRSGAAARSRCGSRSAARSGAWWSWPPATPRWRSSTTGWWRCARRARRVEALEELREQLNLESLPVRIECFDISNLGESNTVASMVGVRGRRRQALRLPQVHDPPRRRPGRLRQHGRGGRPPLRAHGPGHGRRV